MMKCLKKFQIDVSDLYNLFTYLKFSLILQQALITLDFKSFDKK